MKLSGLRGRFDSRSLLRLRQRLPLLRGAQRAICQRKLELAHELQGSKPRFARDSYLELCGVLELQPFLASKIFEREQIGGGQDEASTAPPGQPGPKHFRAGESGEGKTQLTDTL